MIVCFYLGLIIRFVVPIPAIYALFASGADRTAIEGHDKHVVIGVDLDWSEP